MRRSHDVTLVTTSYRSRYATKVAATLAQEGFKIEVMDIRTVKPLDKDLIIEWVKKTGRLIVTDVGWKTFGMAAEILSIVFEEAFDYMKSPAIRVCLPDVPAPEKVEILDAVRKVMK